VFGPALLPFGARGGAFRLVELAVMVRVETLEHFLAQRAVFARGRRRRGGGRVSLGDGRDRE
jgi:hypothetical protein